MIKRMKKDSEDSMVTAILKLILIFIWWVGKMFIFVSVSMLIVWLFLEWNWFGELVNELNKGVK